MPRNWFKEAASALEDFEEQAKNVLSIRESSGMAVEWRELSKLTLAIFRVFIDMQLAEQRGDAVAKAARIAHEQRFSLCYEMHKACRQHRRGLESNSIKFTGPSDQPMPQA